MEAGLAVTVIQLVAVLAAVWLSGRRKLLHSGLPYMVSLAVGVLLATALLHILPDAVAELGNRQGLWLVFAATLFAMFCIERLFSAITGHSVELAGGGGLECVSQHHHHATRPISLVVGGMLHSFVDGVSVTAAFSTGRRVGWLTAIAITLHEVPHRMGDYALLMHLHVSHRRALQLIVAIGLAAVAGVLLVLLVGHAFSAANWLLPVSAASFVYIALVNLLPELAGEQAPRRVALQLFCMVLGGCLVALLLQIPA